MKLSLLVLNWVAKWTIFVLEGLGGTPLPKLSFECPPSRGFCTPLSASLWNSQASYLCCSSCNSLSREWKGVITDSVDKMSLKAETEAEVTSFVALLLKCNLNINVNRCWFQTSIGVRSGGVKGAAAPPKFGQLSLFGKHEKIWAKRVFEDVSMFF